jgi:hypothetical protein
MIMCVVCIGHVQTVWDGGHISLFHAESSLMLKHLTLNISIAKSSNLQTVAHEDEKYDLRFSQQ